jgi:rhodanese-related sulfurtransferase
MPTPNSAVISPHSVTSSDPQEPATPPNTGSGSAVPSRSLERIVREVAAQQESWIGRVRLTTDHRWYERLYCGPDYDVWAISWMPGQGTGFHDHGGSSGAFHLVSGQLEEHRPDLDPLVLLSGDTRGFGPSHVHDVRNSSAAPAISVHAYSPPLTEMTHYAADGAELRPLDDRQGDVAASARVFAAGGRRERGIDGRLAIVRRWLRRLTPTETQRAVESGEAILVDIRPEAQRAREGTISDALVIERNVLEWRLDPTSPDRIGPATGHDLQVILLCSEGYASTLAAESLQALGLWRATDVIGGFQAWRAEGLPCVLPRPRIFNSQWP